MYNLQKYKGITSRYTCPGCGRKRCFTRYVDEAGEPLHETVSPYLQQNATPEDLENHIDIADLLIRFKCLSFTNPTTRHSRPDRESPRKRCLSFLRAARFIAPEHQDEIEALINDMDLDFWGAEKDEAEASQTE